MVKNPTCSAEDPGSIPGSVRSPGEGNGNPLQCSCLENPMDRGVFVGLSSVDRHLGCFLPVVDCRCCCCERVYKSVFECCFQFS